MRTRALTSALLFVPLVASAEDKRDFSKVQIKIEAALRTVSDKPVWFIINTHFHGDHTDGNAVFGQKSTVIAHENTRKRLIARAAR